jgi:hypothetical protein
MAVTINGSTGVAGVDGSASTPALQGSDTNTGIYYPAADQVAVAAGGSQVANFTSSGISDAKGEVRTVPVNSQTSAYNVASSDAGKFISITTGGVSVLTTSAFTVGQSVSIYNNSGSSQTITQGTSVTLRQVGTANTGNRTLAQYGLCTLLCVASNTYVITGGGVT